MKNIRLWGLNKVLNFINSKEMARVNVDGIPLMIFSSKKLENNFYVSSPAVKFGNFLDIRNFDRKTFCFKLLLGVCNCEFPQPQSRDTLTLTFDRNGVVFV